MPSAFGLLAAAGVAINASLVLLARPCSAFRTDGDAVEAALENAAGIQVPTDSDLPR